MIATTWNFGWEVMVTLIVALLVLLCLGGIWILRTPRSHRIRLGFFLERDDAETPDFEDIPPSPISPVTPPEKTRVYPSGKTKPRSSEEDTAEWPVQKP